MTGIMEGGLLPAAVQSVVEPKLDWPLAYVPPRFRHWAMKDGALFGGGAYTILSSAAYVETLANAPGSNRGYRAAVTIQLRADNLNAIGNGLYLFTQALVEEPGFSEMVLARLRNDADLPDLTARVNTFSVTGPANSRTVDLRFDLFNLGTKAPNGPVTVSLYASDDRTIDNSDQLIGTVQVGAVNPQSALSGLIARTGVAGLNRARFAILAVDSAGAVPDLDRNNNTQYERFPIPPGPNTPVDLTLPATLNFTPSGAGFAVSQVAPNFEPPQGKALLLEDDDSVEVGLPFAMPFLGVNYRSVFVNSDGNVTFGTGDKAVSPRDFVRLIGGPPRVAALLRDLSPDRGTITADVRADRAVITWSGVPEWNTSKFNTFQVKLFSSGLIQIAYSRVDSRSGVIGVARGSDQGPFQEIDLSAQLPVTLPAGAIFEEFRQ
jgi:hypothetical protein